MTIDKCIKYGFILNTRPNLTSSHGICSACINKTKKEQIDFEERQSWLTEYIKNNKTHPRYDCVIAVSGGKDSTNIVKLLFENHGISKALLVHVSDNFTHTETGQRNLKNIQSKFNCDLISFNCNPDELSKHMREDFDNFLNPLKWLEEQIYDKPFEIAEALNIKLLFMGETQNLNMVPLKS